MEKKLFLKPRELAAAIGASPSKVYEAIANGSIPSCRIAGLLRVPAAFVDDLVKRTLAPETDESAGR
jgi:excisionase family DNA binding protein